MRFAQIIKKIFTVDWKSLIPLIRQARGTTGRSYYDLCSDIKNVTMQVSIGVSILFLVFSKIPIVNIESHLFVIYHTIGR